MRTVTLPDLTWQTIYAFLKHHPGLYVGNEAKTRQFVEAIVWIVRSGAQWRLLPAAYGNWNSVYKRFARWEEQDLWEQLFRHVAHDPDTEWLALDTTVIRAHASAAGALKKKAVGKAPKRSGAVAAGSAQKSISSSMPWAIR